MEEIKSGVRLDPRPFKEIAKDYIHPAGAVPILWEEKTNFKRYIQRKQNGSYSCVFQSSAKALEVLTGKVISATPYFWRKNYPEAGAWLQDAGDIFLNRYSTTEKLSPSQLQSERFMNKIKPLTTTLGITGYKFPNCKNINEIAEAIEAYGQCIITLGSNHEEYNQTPVYLGDEPTFYHAICAVDYGLVNGQKCLITEDSAGQDTSPDGLRIITEDYLKKRSTGAMYFIGSKDTSVPQDEQLKISIMEKIVALLKELISKYKKS